MNGEQQNNPDPDEQDRDDEVDERGKESFPTSDPPSTWAGPDRPSD